MLFLNIKNKVYIYLIIGFIILIPLLDRNIFFLDVSGKNINYILDLFYGKYIPEYGGTLPISLISIFQNSMFLIMLILSYYSVHKLTKKMTSSDIIPFYAGLLYILNPYTYIRTMTGQWFLLFSYAILPLLLKVFIDLLEKKEDMIKENAIKFIFLLSIVAFNIHMLIIALIIMIIILLFWVNKYKNIEKTKIFLLSGILFIFLNSYWLIPILTAKNISVDDITDKDYKIFSPKGSLFEITAMYGFWREGYLYAKDFLPGWQILFLIILSLAIIGFLSYHKDEKIGFIVKAFATIWIVGFILASGVKGPFSDTIYWLFDNTILKGFRDSHKFVVMMVLSYSILGGLGINKIEDIYDKY